MKSIIYRRWDGSQQAFRLKRKDIAEKFMDNILKGMNPNMALAQMFWEGFSQPGMDFRVMGLEEILMKKKLVFVLIVSFLAATPVMADLTVKYSGASPNLGVNVTSTGHDGTLVTGQYKIDIQGDTGDIIGAPGIVDVFCIDVWDWAPMNPHSYELKPLDQAPDTGAGPMGSVRAGYLATLLNTYWDEDDWNSDTSRTFDLGSGSAVYSANQVAAAAQAAVWEIVDEFNTDTTGWAGDVVLPSGWDVGIGLFHISDNAIVRDIANVMLSNIVGIGPSSFDNYRAVSNSTDASHYQDYVVRVPVPGAVLLGMFGLGLAGLKLRKFA